MKRNLNAYKSDNLRVLLASITWVPPPAPGIAIAAFFDDGKWNENDLLPCLADTERRKAGQLPDPAERRHFILRRCFQRVFLMTVLDWKGALPDLRIEHRLDTQPFCPDAPAYRLSFSSSGSTALACASRNHSVGIDIEKIRAIENVTQLAQRFLTDEEAALVSKCPTDEQNMRFLQIWAAKEAGLKAIGKGIVSGLNTFLVTRANYKPGIEFTGELKTGIPWTLKYLDFLPQHVVAVVHKSDDSQIASL
jgi:phosphopantetheine--protein transferase-like protein